MVVDVGGGTTDALRASTPSSQQVLIPDRRR
jgi:hypothetical protein